MRKINFISEEGAKDLILSETKANLDKGFIYDSEGFAKHCLDTARIGYKVAQKIIKKHPTLQTLINPELIRVQGYMHDFSKIYEGQKYHEIGTTSLVLQEGDTNLKLINGGSKSERKLLLQEMASLIPPDYALFEELGGNNFPDGALYKDLIEKFLPRIEHLRENLSPSKKILSMEEFAIPKSLNQQIALYADLTNINGRRVSVQKRMTELQKRYRDAEKPFYNPIYAEVTDIIRPRIIVIANTIENLMK